MISFIIVLISMFTFLILLFMQFFSRDDEEDNAALKSQLFSADLRYRRDYTIIN